VIESAVRQILGAVGEDPNREGLLDTPSRVARMYEELLEGYQMTPKEVVGGALFESPERDLVCVCDIPFSSLCEHHMLPFTGRAHVAYVPRRHIIGLSKIPRVVEVFAKRLQVQERLTQQIANALIEVLDPQGVMVIIEGEHACASLRGVKKAGVKMMTRATRGVFTENYELQRALLDLSGRR
jgi:GTP cyclohydrolase I